MKAAMRAMENFILLKLVGILEGVGAWLSLGEEVIDDTVLKNGYQLGFPRPLYTSFYSCNFERPCLQFVSSCFAFHPKYEFRQLFAFILSSQMK